MTTTWEQDAQFIASIDEIESKNASLNYDRSNPDFERIYNLFNIAKEQADISGDFAECGVFYGSTAVILEHHNKTMLHLFDSWKGLSEVGENDNPFYNTNTFESTITRALSLFGANPKVKLYNGWIPDRFNDVKDVKFALVHIDVDLYQPTKDSLLFFKDRMSKGGKIVCDIHDGYATGAKKAVDELFSGYAVSNRDQIIISF
jgi:hypothetical protein